MFSNNLFTAKINAVSDENSFPVQVLDTCAGGQTGVVDQMTMCQAADSLDTIEYCTHIKIFYVLNSTACFHRCRDI